MNQEILKVLDMVKDGKISVEEGENLISVLTSESSTSQSISKNTEHKKLLVKVLTIDKEGKEKTNVDVNLPLKLAKIMASFMTMIPQEAQTNMKEKGIDLSSIDLTELIELFENNEIDSELVNVKSTDDENGETTTVRVYVE